MNAVRERIFKEIDRERDYQVQKWGMEFDRENTANDWVTYICRYATESCTGYSPLDTETFESKMLKVAALAVAAIEALVDNGGIAPRHYDI